MPIDDDNVFLIKQFKNCSHFFIEIRSKHRQNDIDTLIEVSVMCLFCGYVFTWIFYCLHSISHISIFISRFRVSQIIYGQMVVILS